MTTTPSAQAGVPWRWLAPLAGAAVACALFVAAWWHPLPQFVYDDGGITLRYAQHLARGDGLAYNAGGRVLHRQVKGGGSYISSNDPRLLIGLGEAERVDRVVVRWPSGERTTLDGLEVGCYHRIVEGEGAPGAASAPGQAS